ncbi:MAG: hypothetical protein A2589_03405 [Candidatus Vogelbacteria bacterium RIFOXYD1_FULL_46_19]|uniref:Transcriptional regulator n=1 Tax=Candidatus Vogelbacteria bacterium RIFOXYD1_FULL_46_19 TaxID=1802439 RepID=A0A1G2QG19_9BACT|nr:MAG: hypothetical protein A2589_03405 [Candidatus Vogelbacteria bacterium RIFOXYD1_FULL_46_19]
MEILEKLFGSKHRVKLMRLFIFNPEKFFERKDIAKRSKVPAAPLRRELNLLISIDFIKSRKVSVQKGKRRSSVMVWELNQTFPLLQILRQLLNADFLRRKTNITKRFKNCGRVKLLVVSGIFIDDDERRLDLLIVGENLKRPIIEKTIKTIEADVGRELTYAVLETEDFLYRAGTSDRFIRDIFDYPHEKVVDKLVF